MDISPSPFLNFIIFSEVVATDIEQFVSIPCVFFFFFHYPFSSEIIWFALNIPSGWLSLPLFCINFLLVQVLCQMFFGHKFVLKKSFFMHVFFNNQPRDHRFS